MLNITHMSPHQQKVVDYTNHFILIKREFPDWALSNLLSQLAISRSKSEIDLAEELLAQYALGRIRPILNIEGLRWTQAEEC
jgi:hypothetical protein